mgnify:CR=1 FL=1
MRVELLVEPGCAAFMDSNTQEIGSCTAGTGAVPVLILATAGVTMEWPGPSHAWLFFLPGRKSKHVGASANPVAPEKEIDAVVHQVPEE